MILDRNAQPRISRVSALQSPLKPRHSRGRGLFLVQLQARIKKMLLCVGGSGGGEKGVVMGEWVVHVVVKSIFPVDVWGCALEQTKNRSFPLSSLHLVGHGRREGAEPRAYFWVAENWPLPRLFVLELFKSNNDRACTHLTSGLVRTNGSKTVRSN